jgi:hypothetical protein
MIIYNITIKVDWRIHEDWLPWMRGQHIPEVMASGCFTGHRMVRLLETDDTEGPTYAIQYFANGLPEYRHYLQQYAPLLRQKTHEAWGDNYVAFRSVMEVLD